MLWKAHKKYSKTFKRRPTTVDLIMSQVFVMCQHIERMSKLSWEGRLLHMSYVELKQSAKRRGVTLATATTDDFKLDTEAWNYMSRVDWQRALEGAYKLYCASQVVDLWGARHSTDFASALFFWGIQVATGSCVPHISSWSSEIAQMFGGNENNALARRAELRDFFVAWSTSIPDAGLRVPLIAGPGRSKCVGNGLGGFGGDSRRPIPELQMALAAAPVIAEHWRAITIARLRTRTAVVPLDTEYAMAAKMFARAFSAQNPTRQKSSISSRRSSRAPSRAPSLGIAYRITSTASSSRASSVDTSSAWPTVSSRASPAPSIASAGSSRTMMSRDDMLRRMNLASRPATPPPQPEPSIEELLATRDDSSDEDADGETDDELVPKVGSSKKLQLDDANAAPFSFIIGPDGFFVAEENRLPSPVETASRKRPMPEVAPSQVKRSRTTPAVPPSPPTTASSTGGRSPSPALSVASAGMLPPRVTPVAPSPTPSLRVISMSPSPSQQALPSLPEEDDVSRYTYLLRREREQYVTYNASEERKRGLAVSVEAEKRLKAWTEEAKAEGRFPQEITPAYLASLGLQGDPRKQDIGRFIIRNSHRWSATECLLRLGLKPLEFPSHLIVHSLLGLRWELDRAAMESSLGPDDEPMDDAELDAELDLLFEDDPDEWRNLICSPDEADVREKLFLKQGIWAHDRSIPEGIDRRADNNANPSPKPPKSGEVKPVVTSAPVPTAKAKASSTRINYGALRKLMGDEDAESEDEGSDEEKLAFRNVLDETLISGVEYADDGECDDDGDDDGKGDRDDDDEDAISVDEEEK